MVKMQRTVFALAICVMGGAAAHADELIGEYRAYISEQDLYNSSRERLTQPWQIIRQDRANYHKFNIQDADDQFDSFFASAANREIMEKLIQRGSIEPIASKAIVQGYVYIDVKIFGSGGIGKSVSVEVSESVKSSIKRTPPNTFTTDPVMQEEIASAMRECTSRKDFRNVAVTPDQGWDEKAEFSVIIGCGTRDENEDSEWSAILSFVRDSEGKVHLLNKTYAD